MLQWRPRLNRYNRDQQMHNVWGFGVKFTGLLGLFMMASCVPVEIKRLPQPTVPILRPLPGTITVSPGGPGRAAERTPVAVTPSRPASSDDTAGEAGRRPPSGGNNGRRGNDEPNAGDLDVVDSEPTGDVNVASTGGGMNACPNWQGRVYLEKSMTLPKGCKFRGVELRVKHQKNLVLDMNGAEFDAAGQEIRGIWFLNTDPDKPTHNIVFKNARFNGYLEGMRVHRGISPREALQVKAGSLKPAQIRATATHHVTIDNVQFVNSRGDGVVFHGGVHHITLKNSAVVNSGAVGVYLGDMTSHIEIANNLLSRNGYRKRNGIPRFGRSRRENLSVDGSFNNRIHGNMIRDAAEGGIAIYKNCYEKAHEPGQLPRTDHANNNDIYNNTIVNNNGFGVHIAERQDWEQSAFKCGDPVYARQSGLFYRDRATGNKVRNNKFQANGRDIVVHDDNNVITGNQGGAILVGSRIRALAGEPVKGTVLKANTGQVRYQFGGS